MDTTTNYEKQAEEFLKKHNIQFNQIECGVTRTVVNGRVYPQLQYFCVLTDYHQGGKYIAIKFTTSVLNTEELQKFRKTDELRKHHGVSAYGFLACITKNDPGTFKEFCQEFGYDEDSIKTLNIYKDVLAEWEQVKNFFTETELQELQEIN